MSDPIVVKLSTPFKFGKNSEPVEELVLKPTARACKELSIQCGADGGFKYEPYKLAEIGLKMAGYPSAVLDSGDPPVSMEDMIKIGKAVQDFLALSQMTGVEP